MAELMNPKLEWPLRQNSDGSFAALEQDTVEEVAQCVAVVLQVEQGDLMDSPQFGRLPIPHGGGDIDLLKDAIRTFEPRAAADLIDYGLIRFINTIDVGVKLS